MKKLILGGAIAVSSLLMPFIASAYNIETISNLGNIKDFVVGPTKVEIEIGPGKTAISNIYVTNRLGRTATFEIELEDVKGSRNPEETVVLLGDDRGPYSLKDLLSVSERSFVLKNGERATIPVSIRIPRDAEPGGRYGSVVLSALPEPAARGAGGVAGGSALVTRIGALFFVTVPGDVKKDGALTDFSVRGGSFLTSGPVVFRMLFENNGSAYLNPYGEIRIRNMFGTDVGALKIDPWYSLPDSLRLREVTWGRELLLGRYTAHASINRGYDDIIDEKTIAFWVIPVKVIVLGFIAIIVIVLLVRWVLSNFKISKRS